MLHAGLSRPTALAEFPECKAEYPCDRTLWQTWIVWMAKASPYKRDSEKIMLKIRIRNKVQVEETDRKVTREVKHWLPAVAGETGADSQVDMYPSSRIEILFFIFTVGIITINEDVHSLHSHSICPQSSLPTRVSVVRSHIKIGTHLHSPSKLLTSHRSTILVAAILLVVFVQYINVACEPIE